MAAVVVAAAVGDGGAAVAGSVGGDEELGLKGPYAEFGWLFHWLVCSQRGTEMRIVISCSHLHHCCKTTDSGSDFWNNLLHTCH